MKFIKEIAKYLGCEANARAVVERRNQEASDYKRYIKKLYEDVKLQGIVIDDGYSEVAVEHPIAPFDLKTFSDLAQIDAHRKTRLEPMLKEVLDRSDTFESFLTNFNAELEDRVKNGGAIGVKTIIAYRTGLQIENPDSSEAKQDFEKYASASAEVRRQHHFDIKRLRDYVIHLAIENCVKYRIPFLIHTGFGDIDCVVEKCGPLNLFQLLKEEQTRRAKIVLIHGGYPNASDVGWLASILENVYVDFSVYAPYSHANMGNRLLQALEMAPISKITYGSDAGELPEGHWVSLKIFKQALGETLDRFIAFGAMNEDEAYSAGEMILMKNIKGVFGI